MSTGTPDSPLHGGERPGHTLRILHVIASMAPEAGGPPVVCAGLTGALAARGHEVSIATVEAPTKNTVPTTGAVKVHAFERSGHPRYLVSQKLDEFLNDTVPRVDVVHLHSLWQFPTFSAARACWKHDKPYVLLPHGMFDKSIIFRHSKWVKKIYWQWRESKIAGRARGIHFLNQAEVDRAIRWIDGMPKFLLPNGISQAEMEALPARGAFRAAHPEIGDRPFALFLSRVHPKKGLERLIPRWRAMAEKMPGARLVIAGTGDAEYLGLIERLIAVNELQGSVIRVGQLVGRAKWEALVDADVFVLPSHQEGFSMAILEALAAGCPPVVTEECNFNELEQTKPASGVVIRYGDMERFVVETVELLRDQVRRKDMAAAGRKLVEENYTWERVTQDLERVYRFIASGGALPSDGGAVWQ